MVDILIKGKAKIPEGTMNEEIPRPDHKDFMTSLELKKAKYSGYRMNRISSMMELWILGEKRGEVKEGDEEGLNKLYNEVFKCSNDIKFD